MESYLLLRLSLSSNFSLGALAASRGGVDVTELTAEVDLSVEECLEIPTLLMPFICASPIKSLDSLFGEWDSCCEPT